MTEKEVADVLRAFGTLSYREFHTLTLQFGLTADKKFHTLVEVADNFGITKERARQIENQALKVIAQRATAEASREIT